MRDILEHEVRLALTIAVCASIIWLVLLVRMTWAVRHGQERRPYILAMPMVGLLASIGTFASAIGFGIQTGVIDFQVSIPALALVSSMGRGALLMGGVIALAYYKPRGLEK